MSKIMDSAHHSRTTVTFVGGVQRLERELIALGRELAIDVEVHDGHVRGHGSARLAALVRRSQVVVIVTGVNSHNAVHHAKRAAEASGARLVIVKFCGAARARALLTEIASVARAA